MTPAGSALYVGTVRHRRFAPVSNRFMGDAVSQFVDMAPGAMVKANFAAFVCGDYVPPPEPAPEPEEEAPAPSLEESMASMNNKLQMQDYVILLIQLTSNITKPGLSGLEGK